MDLANPRTFKMTYTAVAAIFALCAIALVIIHQDVIAAALIVIGCIIIFIGSMIFSRLMQIERLEKLKKM
jgi:Na+/H+ antiporter NhaD/arsenite permease-like protein